MRQWKKLHYTKPFHFFFQFLLFFPISVAISTFLSRTHTHAHTLFDPCTVVNFSHFCSLVSIFGIKRVYLYWYESYFLFSAIHLIEERVRESFLSIFFRQKMAVLQKHHYVDFVSACFF